MLSFAFPWLIMKLPFPSDDLTISVYASIICLCPLLVHAIRTLTCNLLSAICMANTYFQAVACISTLFMGGFVVIVK